MEGFQRLRRRRYRDKNMNDNKNLYKEDSLKYWEEAHRQQACDRGSIRRDDWLDRFSDVIAKARNPVLDLGCGSGNDTLDLIDRGKEVIPCDQSEFAIRQIREHFPEVREALCFNMLDGFPFEDHSFDLVIADLCLHYFDTADTDRILSGIRRILVPGGHLIFRVNSIRDVNHGAGQGREIEPHLYETGAGTLKRFFDEEDIRRFFRDFTLEYLREETMERYRMEKRLFTGCARS